MTPGSSEVPLHPRAPMFALALALASGILLGHYLWRPPIWIATSAAILTISAALLLLRQRPRGAWLVANLAVVCLGWVAIIGQAGRQSGEEPLAQLAPFLEGQEVSLIAHVTRTPAILDGHGDYEQIDVETESLDDGVRKQQVSSGLRLKLYGRAEDLEDPRSAVATSIPQLRYGYRIRLAAKLRPPRNFRNPGAWDYEGYLHRMGIVALGSAKATSIEVLSTDSSDRLGRWRYDARQAVIQRIHALWPAPEAGLMDAMLIGERAFIDRQTSADFQRSGTFHVLVVSGMNVSIFALAIFWMARKLRAGDLLASLVTVAVSFTYAMLCDGGAPILRATFMLSVFLIARLFYRGRSPLNALGIAASGVLMLDSASLLDASFVMTFLCVLIIAGIGVPLLERTSDPWRRGLRNFKLITYDVGLPPRVAQFRVETRMVIARLSRLAPEALCRFVVLKTIGFTLAAWEILLISALMQFGLVLPMAIYFHRVTVTALPANVLVVPLTEILMPASAAAVGLSCFSGTLAHIPAVIAGWSLQGITSTVHTAGMLRVADVRIPTPTFLASIAAALALAVAILLIRRSRVLAATSLGILAASAAYIALVPRSPVVALDRFELTGIDVGQADSTLLVSPDGKALLVDAAGPLGFSRSDFDYGENVVSPYLWNRGFSRLDVVVITHGHSDHLGGMKSIINNFHPRELWVGPLPRVESIQGVLNTARRAGVRVIRLRAGDEFGWAGLHVRVLSPPRDYEAGDAVSNNDSLALNFRYGKTSAMLEGDAERKMEATIATEHPETTVLKLAHNGSLTSTTQELLDAAQPRYALISVGTRNPFHHPRPEILHRLAQRHIETYRTDVMGAVTFLLNGRNVEATTFRPNH